MKKVMPTKPLSYNEWFEKLPFDKQMYVAQHVKKKLDKINEDTTEILDSCYLGAMLEILEMDLDKCIEIASKANENMQITQKILNSEGEKYYMKVNNEKLRSQIRKEAKEMLKSNPKESTLNISRELEKEYKLPIKDLHIIVAEARKERKEENKVEKELPYTVTENEIEANREITIEEASKLEVIKAEFKAPSKLKIIEQTIKIKGEYGIYVKTTEGVKTEKIFVKDAEDLEEYKKAVQGEFDKGKEDLLQQIEDIKEEIINLSKRAVKNFAIIEEIALIFKM